jgi:NADPH-dependent curcumin reductase CurA
MLDETAYHGSVKIGQTLPALGYGTVVASASKRYQKGQVVLGMMGAQTYAKLPSAGLQRKHHIPYLPPTAPLGLMGLTTGLTAYAGTFFVCRPPRKGETVVITASAGAVGSIAAQLAKTTGAKVIGVAGNKNDYLLNDLKLDKAINYRDTTTSLEKQLDEVCPEGVDFVYDNVGGDTLDALLERIRPGGRVVICGAISQYDSGNLNKVGEGRRVQGPSNYLKLAERGAEMKGFNVMQYMHKLPIAMIFMFWYYVRGKVKMTENISVGIKSFASALQGLFSGDNIGKALVKVQTDEESN